MAVGTPSGLTSRPPVVSPSHTVDVSVPTPRISSGLMYSRTRHPSAAAAGTPRTPTNYGFRRRTSATTVTRPPPIHRRPHTLKPRPLPRRPGTARRTTAQDLPSPSTATTQNTAPPVVPPPQESTTPRPPPTPPLTPQPTSRLPEPVVEPHDGPHLRSCVEHYTYTDWARKQRAEPLCSAAIWFL